MTDREVLLKIYQLAGEHLWKSRRRPDTAGHVCDYRNALHAIKDLAKKQICIPNNEQQP